MAKQKPNEKPGWKSTEFWLTLGAMIVGAVAASGTFNDNQWVQLVGGIAAVLAPVAYAQGRSLVKSQRKDESGK